ncbi:MAG: LytTR family DNA-binding domain-containing protein [Bacteroidales bacterium]
MRERKIEHEVLKCIIVDDEKHAARRLETLLNKNPRLTILARISDPRLAVGKILQLKPDLLFLDIQMPVMSGFEVLQAIYQAQVKPAVIFVTAFDEFAIQAIRSSAFDYLLKPVDETELFTAVERMLATYKQKEQHEHYQKLIGQVTTKKLRFNTTGGFMLVNPDDIVYIQADWNYSEIHVSKDKHEVVTMNIGAVEEILPAGQFARISRSVIINLAYLEKVQRARRLCTLRKDEVAYEFKIPILRIRYLESLV